MSIVKRDMWDALLPRKFTTWRPDKIDTIVVHWLGYQPGPQHYTAGVLDEHDLIASIQHEHIYSRGWSDIAYNLLSGVEQFYEGRGLAHRNAANRPRNASSISICALATTGQPDVPDEMLATLQEAIWWVVEQVPTIKHIRPHKRIAKTSCPGQQLTELIGAGHFTLHRPPPKPEVDLSWLDELTPELMWHRICGVKDASILDRFNAIKKDGDLGTLRSFYLSVISNPDTQWIRDTRSQNLPDADVPPHPRHVAHTNDDPVTALMKQYGLSTQQQRDLWEAFEAGNDGAV